MQRGLVAHRRIAMETFTWSAWFTTSVSNICKNQTDISSDPVRNTFKDQHNQLRAAVARGMVKMKDGTKCRNATQMWKLAVKLWYKEIEAGYMNQTTGSQNMWLPQQNIPHFAKMVWDKHKEIGRAIVTCGTKTKAVCHYSPAKEIANAYANG
ncbi:hypothetical protein ANCDUO_16578 [Ancylostoma duodenale]|uniref:SCP domain-containing protein n=1 Tax=Ancylostoma duodenale TaxID=51022 RepID=A0A0C2CU25_9BILA|nr:hypothetical protein ANCDUO_16578 [Ancylostoma duodenale]